MTVVTSCPFFPVYQDPATGFITFYGVVVYDGDCESAVATYIVGDENTLCPQYCPDCSQQSSALSSEVPLLTLFPAKSEEIEFYAPFNFTWGKNSETPRDGFPNEGLRFMGDAGGNFKPVQIAIGERVVNAYLTDIILDGEAAKHPQVDRLWRLAVGFEKEGVQGPLLKGEKLSTYQCKVMATGPEGKLRTYTVLTRTPLD